MSPSDRHCQQPSVYDAAASTSFECASTPILQDVWAITVQNEPTTCADNYEAMHFTAESERDFIRDHLGPLLRERHPHTLLLACDDNKDIVERWADTVLNDPVAANYTDGIAFHWCVHVLIASSSSVRHVIIFMITWRSDIIATDICGYIVRRYRCYYTVCRQGEDFVIVIAKLFYCFWILVAGTNHPQTTTTTTTTNRYSGDQFDNVAAVRRKFPHALLIATEATEGGDANFSSSPSWTMGEHYSRDIMGDFNAGTNFFLSTCPSDCLLATAHVDGQRARISCLLFCLLVCSYSGATTSSMQEFGRMFSCVPNLNVEHR